MGRQHTIYLSDVTWKEMAEIKREDESMSQVIRAAIHTCWANRGKFDLIVQQTEEIERLRNLISTLVSEAMDE